MNKLNYDHLKLENQICHRLYLASNATTRFYRPLLEPLGLSYPQYIVLMALWEKDNISLGELTHRTNIDKGFLSTLIQKLENDKVITLEGDEQDKRKKIIKLSKKGWKLREKAHSLPQDILCHYDLPDNFDYKKFMELLDIVIKGGIKK